MSEARYLAVNGQFGSQYKQEDGVEFKEESDDQGNRKGSYSYIDPNGVRRTVTYTAGKDGFRATGDHIPIPSVPAIPAVSSGSVVPSVPVVPAMPTAPSSVSSEQYNPEDDYDDSSSKTIQDQYNYQLAPQSQHLSPQSQQQQNPQTFTQLQPQYNPSFIAQSQPLYRPPERPPYNPIQFNYQSPPVSHPGYNQFSTEPPHRLSHPGKLSLNRSPDGYSYTFNKL